MTNFFQACRNGDLQTVQNWISTGKGVVDLDVNWGMMGACYGGHLAIVELMISNGANRWNCGLAMACEGGNMSILELMISNGARDWNWGLEGACYHGRQEIIDLLISKGANDWSLGLENACRSRKMHIIELMLRSGATNYDPLWRYTIDLGDLVYEWCLPLSVLQRISFEKYKTIRKNLSMQKRFYDIIFISDLGEMLLEYLVWF